MAEKWRHLKLAVQSRPRGYSPSVMLLRDQFPDLGHQIVRYIHDGFGRFNANFVLYQCLVFGLFSVVGKDPLHPALIPPVWNLFWLIDVSSFCACDTPQEASRQARRR